MRSLLLLGCLVVTTLTTGCVVTARGGAYAGTDDRWDTNRSRTTTYRSTASRPSTTRPSATRPSTARPYASRASDDHCPPGHRWSDGRCHDTGKGHDPNKHRGNAKAKKKKK